jgi:hypothetical protein
MPDVSATTGKKPAARPAKNARLTLLGVGAMNSPLYAPAGLLIEYAGKRIMIDGGKTAAPKGKLTAWLVSDATSELRREIREQARAHGVEAEVALYRAERLLIKPMPVVHTSHPTYGYSIKIAGTKVVWAPEFLEFPSWARNAELMFADAAGWNRPILFAHRTGGHASALSVAENAKQSGVKQLIFAHIGRPTIKAMNAGKKPPFGEFGKDNMVYVLSASGWTRKTVTRR